MSQFLQAISETASDTEAKDTAAGIPDCLPLISFLLLVLLFDNICTKESLMFISWPVLYAVIIKLTGGCICGCSIVCPWHMCVWVCTWQTYVSVWHCVGVHMANACVCVYGRYVWVCVCITDLCFCVHVCVALCVCGNTYVSVCVRERS